MNNSKVASPPSKIPLHLYSTNIDWLLMLGIGVSGVEGRLNPCPLNCWLVCNLKTCKPHCWPSGVLTLVKKGVRHWITLMSYSAKERDFTFSLHAEHPENWKRQKNPSWDQTSCYCVLLKWGEWVALTCAASVCRLWTRTGPPACFVVWRCLNTGQRIALLLSGYLYKPSSWQLCVVFKRKSQRYLLRENF